MALLKSGSKRDSFAPVANNERIFSLTTYVGAKKVGGAPEGSYHVVVELERPAGLVALPTVYTVEPRENDFTIVIEKRRR